MTRVTILFQGTKQNPPSSEDPQHVVVVVRFGAMVRKVTVTQTQARRTQQDSNTSALVCDVMTFLHMMTERCSSSNSNGGAVQLRTSTSLFLSATSLCLRCEKQVRQWIVSDNEIRLDHGCHECRPIMTVFICLTILKLWCKDVDGATKNVDALEIMMVDRLET